MQIGQVHFGARTTASRLRSHPDRPRTFFCPSHVATDRQARRPDLPALQLRNNACSWHSLDAVRIRGSTAPLNPCTRKCRSGNCHGCHFPGTSTESSFDSCAQPLIRATELEFCQDTKAPLLRFCVLHCLVIPNGLKKHHPQVVRTSESLSRASCLWQRRGKSLYSFLLYSHFPHNLESESYFLPYMYTLTTITATVPRHKNGA